MTMLRLATLLGVIFCLCRASSGAEIDVSIYRTAAGQKYLGDKGGNVPYHEVSLRPKGYTPNVGEDTPVFKLYSWWTTPSKLNPVPKKIGTDDLGGGLKCYKVTRISDGTFTWYLLSDLNIGNGNYVDQWDLIDDTDYMMHAGNATQEPYFNKWFGDPLELGSGIWRIEEFNISVEIVG